ncbi:hypothetical protein [Streptomyces griseus]|uniref:hypothetical protein n=1 Tax=Streptomyces griseus TaxID=1911 RepID=UPI00379210D0
MPPTLQWNANRFERTARSVMWTLSAHSTKDQLTAPLPLEDTSGIRQLHAYWSSQPLVHRIDLEELTTHITERFITLDELPAPERSADPLRPPEGARWIRRHFRFTEGALALATPDDVRTHHAWLTGDRRGPAPCGAADAWGVAALMEVPGYLRWFGDRLNRAPSPRPPGGPDNLRLLEVTLTRYARPISLADLPS